MGDVLVYIGLPGNSYHAVRYNQTPKGTLRLPQALVDLDDQIGALLMKAILAGKGGEDESEGYALSKDDPATRSKQLEFRDEARKNEAQLFKVLHSSGDAEQRALAAEALGYVHQTQRQIAALVNASFDANDEVRNNAARALGVLLNAKPKLRRQIPSKPFIDLLSSGSWTDRNKGLMVVFAMAQGRNPEILRELRSHAAKSLIEMAQWYKGHAFAARMILGWIAGIEDQKLHQLADEEPPTALLNAVEALR
jgi:HEAT repeat protein